MYFNLILRNSSKQLDRQLTLNAATFNVNACFGRAKRTLMHVAASVGATECTAVLLARKANPNVFDLAHNSPLHLAARNGYKVFYF